MVYKITKNGPIKLKLSRHSNMSFKSSEPACKWKMQTLCLSQNTSRATLVHSYTGSLLLIRFSTLGQGDSPTKSKSRSLLILPPSNKTPASFEMTITHSTNFPPSNRRQSNVCANHSLKFLSIACSTWAIHSLAL